MEHGPLQVMGTRGPGDGEHVLVNDSPQQGQDLQQVQLQPLPDRSILSTDRTRVVRLPYDAYEQIEDQVREMSKKFEYLKGKAKKSCADQ